MASSLARLIRKERGGTRVTEGHFPNQADRSSYVHIEGDQGSLVLITNGPGAPMEERTAVPRSHAEALLDVTPGKVDYVRTDLSIGSQEVHISRFVTPGPLDLIVVEFEDGNNAKDFRPLPWFGPEVTTEAAYQNRSIALNGLPPALDVPLSNAALNSLLDTLENRFSSSRQFSYAQPAQQHGDNAEARRRTQPSADKPAANAPKHGQVGAGAHEGSASDDLNLDIEDSVIRELARSLRPQQR
ncbi:hypothetical protein [Microvirga puerhi]|uniref:CYTH domain-containing protein n=1 Tax=Microvirga puerhi TaxID=2876078 RepID=A0ABS7VVW9_9HYPH|nr:hypothetical protein [Microvirga puerhi]MBZ6079329.1 hypothetical protein [Microvirga puerhi]